MLRAIVVAGVALCAAPAFADVAAGERALQEGRYGEAAAEFRAAARQGDPAAQLRLGQLYAEGRGVAQDFVEAHKWFNVAAAAGSAVAQSERDRLAQRMTPGQIAQAQQAAVAFEPEMAAEFAPDTPNLGASDYSIAALQRALNEAGFDAGAPDGVPGPRTRAAIRAYQQAAGLPVTGTPSPELHARLTGISGTATITPAPEPRAVDAATLSEIQAELRRRGYDVAVVSGRLDATTRDAIRRYQADVGLLPTGEPTPELLANLQGVGGAPGSDPAQVARVQQALNEMGYDAGPASGVLSPRTQDALRTFQADHGLPATGRLDERSLATLQAAYQPAQPATPEEAFGQIIEGVGREALRSLMEGDGEADAQ